MSIGMPDSAQTSHILGVDFGVSKIGLAIADDETKIAFTLDTIKNDKDFLRKMRDIVTDKNVKTVVVGMTEHGKDDESAKLKLKFAMTLENELDAEVVFQEEMFTTKMAHANIKLHGGKNISKTDDQESARIILQEWLDGAAS